MPAWSPSDISGCPLGRWPTPQCGGNDGRRADRPFAQLQDMLALKALPSLQLLAVVVQLARWQLHVNATP